MIIREIWRYVWFLKFKVNFKYFKILVNKNYVPVMNYGDIVKQNNGYLVIQVNNSLNDKIEFSKGFWRNKLAHLRIQRNHWTTRLVKQAPKKRNIFIQLNSRFLQNLVYLLKLCWPGHLDIVVSRSKFWFGKVFNLFFISKAEY